MDRRTFLFTMLKATVFFYVMLFPLLYAKSDSDYDFMATDDVQRLNYGVIFEKVAVIEASASSWSLTIAVPWLDIHEIVKVTSTFQHKQVCLLNITDAMCDEFSASIKTLNYRIKYKLKELRHYLNELDRLSSFKYGNKGFDNGYNSERKTRSILPIIGQISKTLFGTATTKDVSILARHISSVEQELANQRTGLRHFSADLSSVLKITNRRIDNLWSSVNNTFSTVEQLTLAVADIERLRLQTQRQDHSYHLSNDQFHRYMLLLNALDDRSRTLDVLIAKATERLIGMQTLLEGYLPPEFVSSKLLENSLQKLQDNFQKKYSQYHLCHETASYYHRQKGATFYRNGHNIYINIPVPLCRHSLIFDVFKVIHLPIPSFPSVAQNTNGTAISQSVTVLNNLPNYFAIQRNGDYFLEMSTAEFQTCQGLSILICQPLTILKPDLPSCARAVLLNQHSKVLKWCNPQIIVRHTGIQRAQVLRNSQVLIQGYSSDWHLSCNDAILQKIEKCHFCVITIPCGCLLFSKKYYIDTLGNSCQQDHDIVYSHTLNIPVLMSLYSTALPTLKLSTLSDNPTSVQLPDVQILETEWKQTLSTENDIKIDLNRAATMLRDNSKVFLTPMDQFRQENINFNDDPSVFTMFPNSIWVTLALSCVNLALSIYLMWKMRNFSIALQILLAKRVEAQEISWFISTNPSPTKPFEPPHNTDYIKYIVEAICIFALCFIFMTTYKYCLRAIKQYWHKLMVKTTASEASPIDHEMHVIPILPTISDHPMCDSSKDMTSLPSCTIHDNPLQGPFIHEDARLVNSRLSGVTTDIHASNGNDISRQTSATATPLQPQNSIPKCDPLNLTWFTI